MCMLAIRSKSFCCSEVRGNGNGKGLGICRALCITYTIYPEQSRTKTRQECTLMNAIYNALQCNASMLRNLLCYALSMPLFQFSFHVRYSLRTSRFPISTPFYFHLPQRSKARCSLPYHFSPSPSCPSFHTNYISPTAQSDQRYTTNPHPSPPSPTNHTAKAQDVPALTPIMS